MGHPLDTGDFHARLQRLDDLVRAADRAADPAVRARTRDLVQALLDLHGLALERLLEHVAAAGEAGRAILDACARDDVAGGLMLLHGLHPLGPEERVRQALDDVRPALHAHGGGVEFVEYRDGIVRLRLQGHCHQCPSSSATVRQTVEAAVLGRAPEVAAVEVEGLSEAPSVPDRADRPGARLTLPVL